MRYLLDALRRASKTERIVVLISRMTFSAAENFATDLERVAHPIFVGEPSGGSPNLYGDTANTLLPASGVELRVAEIYWQKSTADDPRIAIDPQVPVSLSSEAFFAGRDPVLAAAVGAALGAPKLLAATPPRFSYDRARPLGLRLGEAQTSGGVVRQPLTFDAGRGQKKAYWTHPEGPGPWPVVLFSPGIGRRCDEPASGCGPACAPRHRVLDRRPAAGARQLSCGRPTCARIRTT